jgi:hypothetical protein
MHELKKVRKGLAEFLKGLVEKIIEVAKMIVKGIFSAIGLVKVEQLLNTKELRKKPIFNAIAGVVFKPA